MTREDTNLEELAHKSVRFDYQTTSFTAYRFWFTSWVPLRRLHDACHQASGHECPIKSLPEQARNITDASHRLLL